MYAPWNENTFTEAKRAKGNKEGQIPKDRFTYDPSIPSYRCPEGKPLTYRERTTKQKANGDYFTIEIYQADPSDCADCPLKASCVRGRSGARTVRRQEHEELVEELKERMKTPEAKERYGKRCCTVERRFADSKTHRGLQRFSGQTPERADAQVGLTVLAHNLRTLAKLRTQRSEQLKTPEKIRLVKGETPPRGEVPAGGGEGQLNRKGRDNPHGVPSISEERLPTPRDHGRESVVQTGRRSTNLGREPDRLNCGHDHRAVRVRLAYTFRTRPGDHTNPKRKQGFRLLTYDIRPPPRARRSFPLECRNPPRSQAAGDKSKNEDLHPRIPRSRLPPILLRPAIWEVIKARAPRYIYNMYRFSEIGDVLRR